MVKFLPLVFMMARLRDVSTKPSMSLLMRMTPLGAIMTVLIIFWVSASVMTLGYMRTGSSFMKKSGSTRPSSFFTQPATFSSSASMHSLWALGMAKVMEASRGMALRILPPSTLMRRMPQSATQRMWRKRSLLALARPVLISMPLWPPLRPPMVRRMAQ